MATACSSVLGPVLGGIITAHTTWRVSNLTPLLRVYTDKK